MSFQHHKGPIEGGAKAKGRRLWTCFQHHRGPIEGPELDQITMGWQDFQHHKGPIEGFSKQPSGIRSRTFNTTRVRLKDATG